VTDAAGSAEVPRILAGSPTEEEAAAVAAVFAQILLERAAARAEVPREHRPNGWQRSIRPLRRWNQDQGGGWD
jgi:hypothetical protein